MVVTVDSNKELIALNDKMTESMDSKKGIDLSAALTTTLYINHKKGKYDLYHVLTQYKFLQ